MYDGVGYSPISVTGPDGKEITFPLWQFVRAEDEETGSRVYLLSRSFNSSESEASINGKIQTQIDAWLAAFPA